MKNPQKFLKTLEEFFDERAMKYALYTILSQHLPMLGDGLKPVHRRLLYIMLTGNTLRYSKSAMIVGECMGRLHPHGDSSLYESLISLTNFDIGGNSLVDFQGNSGAPDMSENAAAMRYTEACASDFAKHVFSKYITETKRNYADTEDEPVTLACKLPLVLLKPLNGVAYSLNTLILPHSPVEALNGQIKILKAIRDKKNIPKITLYPELPWGGNIDVTDYKDGLGKIVSYAIIEEDSKKNQLLIRELSYQCDADKTIDNIQLAGVNRKTGKGKPIIPLSRDIDNDGKSGDVCLTLPLKKNADSEEVKYLLFKKARCKVTVGGLRPYVLTPKPEVFAISKLLEECTRKLVEFTSYELKVDIGKSRQILRRLRLKKTYVVKKIWKKVPKTRSLEDMHKMLSETLGEYLPKLKPITREDTSYVSSLPQTVLSNFDLKATKEKIKGVLAQINDLKYKLKNIENTCIDWIRVTKKKFFKGYKRKTGVVCLKCSGTKLTKGTKCGRCKGSGYEPKYKPSREEKKN